MGNASGIQLVIVCNDERGMGCYGRKDLFYCIAPLPPPPLWPARIFINNNNLPSIHVIKKQTRAKLVAKATRGLPFE